MKRRHTQRVARERRPIPLLAAVTTETVAAILLIFLGLWWLGGM